MLLTVPLCILLASIAALPLMSALPITSEAIEVTPVLEMVISPVMATLSKSVPSATSICVVVAS